MFDEPTAGMSADEAPVILDLIRQLKQDRKTKTILLVEHKMDVVRELADRIIVLHNGTAGGRWRSSRGDCLAGGAGGLPGQGGRMRSCGMSTNLLELRRACTRTSGLTTSCTA